MKINRRTLLNYTLKGSALWALNLNLPRALAQSREFLDTNGRFLVHIRTQGGMDSTLGLDPLTHAMYKTNDSQLFLEYKADDIVTAGQLTFGPAAAEALKPFAGDLSIIRGIHMRQDIQHEPLNEFWVRASLSNAGSAFFFDLAERFGSRVLVTNRLPNISVTPQILFGNGGTANYTGVAPEDLDEVTWSMMAKANETDAFSKLAQQGVEVAKIRETLKARIAAVNDPDASVKDGAAAAVFFSNNAAGFAVIDINRDAAAAGLSMDTHNSHEGNHLNAQKNAWETVAKIFQIFKDTAYGQGSLFDATTFVVTTEFSRTPFLNAFKGKDHNVYTNSVLVCGPNIKPGTAIGGSRVIPSKPGAPVITTRHVSRPFDFRVGKALTTEQMISYDGSNRDVKLIFPEDIMATVSAAAFGANGTGVVNGRLIKSLLKA